MFTKAFRVKSNTVMKGSDRLVNTRLAGWLKLAVSSRLVCLFLKLLTKTTTIDLNLNHVLRDLCLCFIVVKARKMAQRLLYDWRAQLMFLCHHFPLRSEIRLHEEGRMMVFNQYV